MTKTILSLIFLASAANAGAGDLKMTCGTDGEGLDLTMTIGQTAMTANLDLSYPNGETKNYSAAVGNGGVYDLLSGNQVYLIGETDKTVRHGGTITDSALVVIESANQETPKRSTVVAVDGKTYLLNCTLDFE